MARPKSVTPRIVFAEITVDPASIAGNTTLDVTVTVKGLRPGFPVTFWAPNLEANLSVGNAHASAVDTLKFRLGNHTAVAIDPASQLMYVVQG